MPDRSPYAFGHDEIGLGNKTEGRALADVERFLFGGLRYEFNRR